MRKLFLVTIILLSGSALNLMAQKSFSLSEKDSKVWIEGTSNLHDWDMHVEDMKGNVSLMEEANFIKKFDGVLFEVESKSISSHSSIMDGKAHSALKAEKYPFISFKMTQVEDLDLKGDYYTANISGILSIAGKTRHMVLKASGQLNGESRLTANGSLKLHMTDFGIEPPTAIMGTLKTGDQVTIKFELIFKA